MEQVPYYLSDVSKLKYTLETYGVAVLYNVLEKSEIEFLRNTTWMTLEGMVGLDRYNISSYEKFSLLEPLHGMLLQHYIGHSQPLWDVRQHKKVVEAFASIYGDEATVNGVVGDNLVTSFDGTSISLPPEITRKGWHMNLRWHCDQSYKRHGFETIQSWVTLYDSGGSESTMCVFPRSHLLHSEFHKYFPNENFKDDYYEIGGEEDPRFKFYTSCGIVPTELACPAGSMVLWDSRTIHTARGPLKGRNFILTSSPPTSGIRTVFYICMAPRSRCTPNTLKKRVKIFENGRMTYHHPYRVRQTQHHRYSHRNEHGEIEIPPPPLLTPLGRRLVGYEK